ncbi:anthrax toxin lethal factor-related metalloendopeptidase [Cytobacillus horneckiae]|uniref:Toxin n=1 Tax=Cytobacillus horneckiae TaxID=549687 RepID=A0A2N0ZKP7_9BACI|nr:toxin [Cytobacillus horneckiae]MEC1156395.1 toxin [Cytobacillus horneckiae]MED2938412.1 toxin [Cytobacillus horneckiae]PKG30082.1 toxin [Cytobacillus horneckiae]
MKKMISILSILTASLALMGSSQADIGAVRYKDFPVSSILKSDAVLRSAKEIGNIILLPVDAFDEEEAAKIVSTIDHLPQELLAKVVDENIKVKLFSGRLTENSTARHLAGIIPRGYESALTWDEVPGIGGGKTVLVKIGFSEKGMGHGSVNLELHELAHSIERHVYKEIRYNHQFQSIWKEEHGLLFPGHAYFATFPEEYFAESFALYFYNAASRSHLYENAPKTFNFIKNLQ